jgi:hypothetical protein
VNFSGPEGATPLGNGALAAEPGLAEASRRVLAGFAQAVDSINCMSLSEYVYIYIIIITITITISTIAIAITIIIITITSLRSHWNLSNILHINMYTKQNYI